MSKQTEALKLALEALEECRRDPRLKYEHPYYDKALAAIREALAEQPAQQQEPVAWATRMGEYAHIHWGAKRPEYPVRYEVPLYTSPPAQRTWAGLTDAEWMNIVNKDHAWFGQRPEDVAHEVAKLVEAKLKEKNA